jgi:prepilin peptidase CpaA
LAGCKIVLVTTIGFLLVMGTAAGYDLATRRIPNWLVLGGTVLALTLRGLERFDLFWDGLWGCGLAFAITLPFFALGALGGGDAKLIMTVGAFMGASDLVGALLVIAVVGGIIAVLYSAWRGVTLPVILNSWAMLKSWLTVGWRGNRPTVESAGGMTIPYGLAIAVGAVLWWFWGGSLV